jgi:formylglycine-generating enzyme required for sulfatase activity
MLGNVWEWTSDWYADQLPAAVSDPTGPSSGQYRTLRGGSWEDNSDSARVSERDGNLPDFRVSAIGFRYAGESL